VSGASQLHHALQHRLPVPGCRFVQEQKQHTCRDSTYREDQGQNEIIHDATYPDKGYTRTVFKRYTTIITSRLNINQMKAAQKA
jgi:hypothetical protein